jgi:hypothetical protein
MSFVKYGYILGAAALGFAFTYLLTHRSGIGVSPDSIAYISAARNMVHTGHLVDYTLHPLVDWPAGYPLLLAAILKITHADPMAVLPWLNPLLFAVLIGLCGYIAIRLGYPSRWFPPVLLLCIALSPALVEVYIMLWSEALFIPGTVVFFILLQRYMKTRALGSLLPAAGCAALCCVIRYSGVTLVATGGFLILIDRYPTWRKKVGHLMGFGAISLSLLFVNLFRNEVVSGTLTGARQKGMTPLWKNIYYYGNTFTGWFLYGTTHYHLCLLLGMFLIIFLVLLFGRGIPKLLQVYPPYIRICLSFALLYSLFMVVSATLSRYETINSRLLSPLYIPLVFTLAYPLEALWYRRTWRVAAVGCALLVLSSQAFADRQWYADVKEGGIGGYTEDTWDDSPLVAYLKGKPFQEGYTLYSNSPEAVYFFGRLHCQLLPQQAFPGPIRQFYSEPRAYLIWFEDGDNDAILTLDQVLTHKHMVLVRRFDDGVVYETAN